MGSRPKNAPPFQITPATRTYKDDPEKVAARREVREKVRDARERAELARNDPDNTEWYGL